MILSGRLEDWSVSDLLHMLRVTRKSASLAVAGDGRSGVLHFHEGMIVDADLTGSPLPSDPRSRVVETIYVLQTMTSGEFAIGSPGAAGGGDILDVAEVLTVAAERLEMEEGLRSSGLLDADGLGLVPSVSEHTSVHPDDWEVLAEIIATFTFPDLEERIGRSRAVAFLGSLDRLGVVEIRQAPAVVPLRPNVDEASAPEVPSFPEPRPVESAAPSPWTVPDWDGEEVASAGLQVVIEDSRSDSSVNGTPSEEGQSTRRREMRSVISPADTTLVPGVLSDIRQRFRPVDSRG